MNKFKPGDKVIVKKLSEKEFEEVYNKKHNWSYGSYLKRYENDFGKTFTILKIDKNRNYWVKEINYWFFEEELELAHTIKDQIEFIQEILL